MLTLDKLAALAASIFRDRSNSSQANRTLVSFTSDSMIAAAHAFSSFDPSRYEIEDVGRQLVADPRFSVLASQNGLGPMILHAGGGFRTSTNGIIAALLQNAFLRVSRAFVISVG